jgi:hypothetical protein
MSPEPTERSHAKENALGIRSDSKIIESDYNKTHYSAWGESHLIVVPRYTLEL